jgi:hypothetical protein
MLGLRKMRQTMRFAGLGKPPISRLKKSTRFWTKAVMRWLPDGLWPGSARVVDEPLP